MAEEGFYVTLPSNASKNMFPDNTISTFRVDLARHIDLDGAWRVALVEIAYPRTWLDIPEKMDRFSWIDTYEDGTEDKPLQGRPMDPSKFTIHKTDFGVGSFDDIEVVVNRINARLKKSGVDAVLARHPCDHRFSWSGSGRYYMRFNAPLAYMLGMKHGEWVRCGPGDTLCPYPPDIKAGFYHLYCYSDLVQHQVVGDSYAPLLRAIPVTGKYGQVVTKTFNPAYYLPVSKRHIESVAVDIKNDQNESVKFTYGKVVLTLHFKPDRTVRNPLS